MRHRQQRTRPGARSNRGTSLGQAHLDLNTRELHQIGATVLDIALPGATAAAEEAQEDGFDSTRKEELLKIVSGPTQDRNLFDVSDYYDDPVGLGSELVRELEALGYRLVK